MDWISTQAIRHGLNGVQYDPNLLDADAQTAHAWISGYKMQYGTPPSEQMVATTFNIGLDQLQPWPQVQEQLYERFVERSLQPLINSVMDGIQAKKKFSEILQTLLDGGHSIQAKMASDTNAVMLIAGLDERFRQRYDRSQYNYTNQFGTFGMPQLDNATNGICEGDFLVLYGPSSQGKSTIKRSWIGNMVREGLRVLSISLEEPKDLEASKMEAILTHAPLRAYLRYEMPPAELVRVYQDLAVLKAGRGECIIYDKLFPNKSWDTITMLVAKHAADIVVVDQLSQFAGREWKEISAAMSEGRQWTIEYRPAIMLTQDDGKGGIKYAKSVYEDATKVIRTNRNPETATDLKLIIIEKNRDGEVGTEIPIKYEPENSFVAEIEGAQPPDYHADQVGIANPAAVTIAANPQW